MKLQIVIDDPETRAVWETAQRAKAEVAGWPAWKRGDQAEAPSAAGPSDPPRRSRPNNEVEG